MFGRTRWPKSKIPCQRFVCTSLQQIRSKIPCQMFVCASLQQIELPRSAHLCGLCLGCFGLSLEASRRTHRLMHRDGQPRIFPVVMLVHCCKAASGPRRIFPWPSLQIPKQVLVTTWLLAVACCVDGCVVPRWRCRWKWFRFQLGRYKHHQRNVAPRCCFFRREPR